jgi:hypothetical protein
MKKIILLLLCLKMTFTLFSQDPVYNWDTITFEKAYKYLKIDTSVQNIWQIGAPHKIFFDSTYSGKNAIVTDTLHNYPVNNNSFFDLKIGAFNFGIYYPASIILGIKHKYDTDTLRDGGYITISYDNGKTWANIIKDTVYQIGLPPPAFSSNLYSEQDSLFNGEYGFSGNSGGWITTWFSWRVLWVKKSAREIADTMILRFNFVSDSIPSNKEGWMIDNIRLSSDDIGGGILKNENGSFKIYPNPMKDLSSIEFDKTYSSLQVGIFDLNGKLIEQRSFTDKQVIYLYKRNLKSGMYILKIIADRELIGISKLIIN